MFSGMLSPKWHFFLAKHIALVKIHNCFSKFFGRIWKFREKLDSHIIRIITISVLFALHTCHSYDVDISIVFQSYYF